MRSRVELSRLPRPGVRGVCSALALSALSFVPVATAANPVTRPTPAGDEARALARTALGLPLSQRSVGPFSPVKAFDGAKVTLEEAGGDTVLRLADGHKNAGYVGVSAKLPPQMTVRQRQVLKVAAQRLGRERARAVVSANSNDGRAYQAGVYRNRSGALKWAVWRRDTAGRLIDLAVSPKRARLDRWTKVDLLSNWNRPGSQATLRVDGTRAATTRIRDLTGTLAARVTLGFGRPESTDERGVMLVRAARVDSSIPTEPLVVPTTPTPEMIAKEPPPPPPPSAAAESGPPPPANQLPGREIHRADFESGDLRQWSGRQAVSSERIKVVGSPAREGLYAGRFEVRNGENPIGFGDRAEVQLSVNERDGDERWYSWSTMFDQSFPTADSSVWQVVSQWHCTCDGPPSLGFYVWEENYYLQMRNAQGTNIVWRTGLDRGQWHDIVVHVKWSDDPGVGYVELWHNGVPVTGKLRGATLYPGESAYFKQGYYRRSGEPRTGVVYHDGFRANAV